MLPTHSVLTNTSIIPAKRSRLQLKSENGDAADDPSRTVIVGATFIAGLIVGAQRDDANGPVDLIIVNGKVYSGDGAELQEAVAVRGNQILRVGSNREVKRLRRAQTVVVDAHGASVLPGLNDSHVELMAGALAFEHLNLPPATVHDIATELRYTRSPTHGPG